MSYVPLTARVCGTRFPFSVLKQLELVARHNEGEGFFQDYWLPNSGERSSTRPTMSSSHHPSLGLTL